MMSVPAQSNEVVLRMLSRANFLLLSLVLCRVSAGEILKKSNLSHQGLDRVFCHNTYSCSANESCEKVCFWDQDKDLLIGCKILCVPTKPTTDNGLQKAGSTKSKILPPNYNTGDDTPKIKSTAESPQSTSLLSQTKQPTSNQPNSIRGKINNENKSKLRQKPVSYESINKYPTYSNGKGAYYGNPPPPPPSHSSYPYDYQVTRPDHHSGYLSKTIPKTVPRNPPYYTTGYDDYGPSYYNPDYGQETSFHHHNNHVGLNQAETKSQFSKNPKGRYNTKQLNTNYNYPIYSHDYANTLGHLPETGGIHKHERGDYENTLPRYLPETGHKAVRGQEVSKLPYDYKENHAFVSSRNGHPEKYFLGKSAHGGSSKFSGTPSTTYPKNNNNLGLSDHEELRENVQAQSKVPLQDPYIECTNHLHCGDNGFCLHGVCKCQPKYQWTQKLPYYCRHITNPQYGRIAMQNIHIAKYP